MKIKKNLLTISLAMFMVFSLSFTTSESFAYWTNSVIGDTSDVASASVTTGTWVQAFPWDTNETYSIGDEVTNNGTTYRAKKNNPTREPGVSGGWKSEWTAL